MINNHSYSSKFKEKILIKEKRTIHIRRIRRIRSMRQNSMRKNNNYKTRILRILKILYSHIGEIFTLSGAFLSDTGEGTNWTIRIACLLIPIVIEIILSLAQESK